MGYKSKKEFNNRQGSLSFIFRSFRNVKELIFPAYRVTKLLLKGEDQCYCNSGLSYARCHKKGHKKEKKVAIKVIKTFLKSGEVKIKYQIRSIPTQFKPGDINPLNKGNGYVDTSGYDSIV